MHGLRVCAWADEQRGSSARRARGGRDTGTASPRCTCVYACVCVRMCVGACVGVRVRVGASGYACVGACMCARVFVCIYVCVYVHMRKQGRGLNRLHVWGVIQ